MKFKCRPLGRFIEVGKVLNIIDGTNVDGKSNKYLEYQSQFGKEMLNMFKRIQSKMVAYGSKKMLFKRMQRQVTKNNNSEREEPTLERGKNEIMWIHYGSSRQRLYIRTRISMENASWSNTRRICSSPYKSQKRRQQNREFTMYVSKRPYEVTPSRKEITTWEVF
jgi:hypothetical protein